MLKENILDASLSRGLVGGPPLVWRTREVPPSLVLVSFSKLPFLFTCFSCSSIYSMLCFVVHYAYAMIIRLVIYMFSYLRHPCFKRINFYEFSPCFLTNMYALDLMHMHIHNDHMSVYDFCFVLISMLNAMY